MLNGFNLDDLAPNGVSTINYDVTADNPLSENLVTNFPSVVYTANDRPLNENTNTINFVVVSNRLAIEKSVDKSVAIKGEMLHYSNKITNTGTLLKTNLLFTDSIPNGTTFVEDSVKIDGISQPGYNPAVGFALANLPVGASTIVEFDVVVN